MSNNNRSDLQRTTRLVHGLELAYQLRSRNVTQRAVLAARCDPSNVTLICATGRQWASIYRVPIQYLIAARALSDVEQQRVLFEMRSLIEPQDRLKAAIRAVGGADEALEVLCTL